MRIRAFRAEDAEALGKLSASCARGEADFVLNPMWDDAGELVAEFDRWAVDATTHVLVADLDEGEPVGLSGFLRAPGERVAALLCPIVDRSQRGRGIGGKLLRAAVESGGKLGIELVTAAIGTRNRAGYSLLTSLGFRPVRQHFLMRCDDRPEVGRKPIENLELDAAKPEDAETILDIYLSCGLPARTLESMQAVMSDGRHAHAVARHDGRIVAFTEIETHWPRRNWVAFVGVRNDVRQRGVGTALCSWAVSRRFEAGAQIALLMLSPANRDALRAYEKVGFRRHRLVDVLEKSL